MISEARHDIEEMIKKALLEGQKPKEEVTLLLRHHSFSFLSISISITLNTALLFLSRKIKSKEPKKRVNK
jgi:hypothetical protein